MSERPIERIVKCVKLDRELAGLSTPPFAGPLGQEIYEKVSNEAWLSWKDDMMIKIINEYRLNLADPEHYQSLIKQMRAFLNLGESEKLLEVENAERGRS